MIQTKHIMKIETKLSMYDEAFFMKDNKIISDEINHITIWVDLEQGVIAKKTRTKISYSTLNHNNFDESDLFKTKQDLLDSL